MKKLKLKIQDLENPSILTHREIKNILGGAAIASDGTVTCKFEMMGGDTLLVPYYGWAEAAWADVECMTLPGCLSVISCD